MEYHVILFQEYLIIFPVTVCEPDPVVPPKVQEGARPIAW